MVKASTSQLVGHGLRSRPGHTKDFNNGAHFLLVWCLKYKNRMGKLNTLNYRSMRESVTTGRIFHTIYSKEV